MTPSPQLTVSVVIPTLNRPAMLREALLSVVAQDYPIHEIIIVDDGSTQSLKSAISGHQTTTLRLIRHPANRGHAAARNTGIRAATGELIAFLDSDDRWLPGKLSTQARYFQRESDVGLVGGGYEYIDADGTLVSRPRIEPEIVRYSDMALDLFLSGSSTTALCRSDVFSHVGLFDDSLPLLEDWDMWIRISRRYEVRNAQTRIAQVRMHNEPRPHRPPPHDFADMTRIVRLKINARIPEPLLRRRALALTYFRLFTLYQGCRDHPVAFGLLARSAITWPFRIHRYRPRLRALLARALGRW